MFKPLDGNLRHLRQRDFCDLVFSFEIPRVIPDLPNISPYKSLTESETDSIPSALFAFQYLIQQNNR